MEYLFLKMLLFQLATACRLGFVFKLITSGQYVLATALDQDSLFLERSRSGPASCLCNATSSVSRDAPAAALLLCNHLFLLQVTLQTKFILTLQKKKKKKKDFASHQNLANGVKACKSISGSEI